MRYSTDPVPREPQNSFQSLKLCSYCLHRPSLLSCRYVFFYLSDGRNYVIEINSRTSWRDCYARGVLSTLRKQPSFRDTTTAFPAKWRLWDERRNAILMTCRYTDLGSASDWSGKFASASQKHYPNCARFSDVISRETSGGVAKCWLFPWRRGFQLDLLPNFSNFSRPRRQKQHQSSAYCAS